MPNKETHRIRYEVMLACVEGLLRQQTEETWARAFGQLGVGDDLAYRVLLLALYSDEPRVVEAAARSLHQLRMINAEVVDRLLWTLNKADTEGVRASLQHGVWGNVVWQTSKSWTPSCGLPTISMRTC